MKVLVTGANGFIGRHLLPLLAEAGHEVRGLVRTRVETNAAQTVVGALPDASLCMALCSGVDAVVHTAGAAHVNTDAATLRKNNLDATLELAATAKAQGLRKFIFLSSSKARYPLHSSYARLKAEAEMELRKLHTPGTFEVVCLRPALVYGKGMRGNLRALLGVLAFPRLPIFIRSANPLGMISVEDLSRAILAALSTEGLPDQVWELSDGRRYTLDMLVAEIRGALGLSLPALTFPAPLFRFLARLSETAAPLVRSPLSLSTYRTLFEEVHEPDAGFSYRTGFVPQDSFLARLPELVKDLHS